MIKNLTLLIAITSGCFGPVTALAAGKAAAMVMPDFTKGDAIPAGARHDWNLGPTGLRGWMFCDKLVTTDARQVFITKVDPGSPAAGIIAVGDVLLGAGGGMFSLDPRTELGKAITRAESPAGGGKLALTRWRAGVTEEVVVKLPVLGSYSATAPHDCAKSKRIFEQGVEELATRIQDPVYPKKQNPITRSLNALALLAGGDPAHLPLVKKEAEWAAGFSADSFATWYYGYTTMLLAEYVAVTGDQSVMPGLRRLALEAARGQSGVGSWGHKFARPDGILNGYGMMNSPGIPLTISLVMARDAGVRDPEISRAIELSARLVRFYVGKGAVPYGDHHPWTQTHEDNGKCGMAAVLFDLLGDAGAAGYFSRMSVASHGGERDCGHTGNFFNILWALPAVARSGPRATGEWMREYGAWYFDLARRWDGTFPHQGPPEPGNDSYAAWDCTGAYLLAYAQPLKKIILTGRKPAVVPQLDDAGAKSLIADGRGWTNKNRDGAFKNLQEAELLSRLGSWSPVVRGRAAAELAQRRNPPVAAIGALLDSKDFHARVGACEALESLKSAAAPAVPRLRQTLDDPDLWLRIKSADALAAIGPAAMPVLPHLLERLARGPTPEDPRGMEQRFLCFSVFGRMLGRSLDGVDRKLLLKAVALGLRNEDGRARGELGTVYQRLSFEEIKPLLPAIREAIVKPAPSGEMFADGIRLKGCELFARHHIREGMELTLQLLDLDRWGRGPRLKRCFEILETYGAAAKPLLPRLREVEKLLLADSKAQAENPQVDQLRTLITSIESSTAAIDLRDID
jgi:hypothetical protein